MTPNSLLGIASIACFSIPIFMILFYRLYKHVSLIALMIYYVLIILHCLGSNTVPPAPDLQNTWEVLFNYIEIPLMLSALLFFCPTKQKQQKIHFVIGFFIAYEVLIALFHGLTAAASFYVMVPGLLVIVLYSLFLSLRQLRFTVVHGKNWGRVLMLGSLLFSYSCYLFMFYAYFFQHNADISGIFSVHFFSSAIAAVLMSAGLYMMRSRIKELQEIKVTRRELQMVFGS